MYTVGQREEIMAKDASIASLADVAEWAPAKYPHFVRGAMLITTVAGAAIGEVRFDKRPTAGSDTARGDGDVAILAIPNPMAQGKVLLKDNLRVRINPGEEVVAQVTDLVASMTAHIVLLVEPSPEILENLTNVVETL